MEGYCEDVMMRFLLRKYVSRSNRKTVMAEAPAVFDGNYYRPHSLCDDLTSIPSRGIRFQRL